MRVPYCYWSVCDGAYGAMMEHCVATAHAVGVFTPFHALTDRPLAGCECYDCYRVETAHGLFKLHYLKVGMSRLNAECFVWLDADTVFARRPTEVIAAMGRSPIHVPFELNLDDAGSMTEWRGTPLSRIRELFRQEGIRGAGWLGSGASWMVRKEAIETVYDLALGFWGRAREAGIEVHVSVALSYAAQMLCAEPEQHAWERHRELWATDYLGESESQGAGAAVARSWHWRPPWRSEGIEVGPAIVHRAWRSRG